MLALIEVCERFKVEVCQNVVTVNALLLISKKLTEFYLIYDKLEKLLR